MTYNPAYFAINAARQARKSLAGFAVSLRRVEGGDVYLSTGSIRATLGESRVDDILENGMIQSRRLRDFLIDAADYAFEGYSNGEPVAPDVGDEILVTIESKLTTYRVMPSQDERPYRRADRAGFTWRVHTKEIANEAGV